MCTFARIRPDGHQVVELIESRDGRRGWYNIHLERWVEVFGLGNCAGFVRAILDLDPKFLEPAGAEWVAGRKAARGMS